MQVSTVHDGTLITGVVLRRTPFFLEVAIVHPFSNLSTSRCVPPASRQHIRYTDETLESECSSLLLELYEVASKAFSANRLSKESHAENLELNKNGQPKLRCEAQSPPCDLR